MDKNMLLIIGVIIIVLVCVVLFLKKGNIKPKKVVSSGLDLKEVFLGVGGKENITSIKAENSKVVFILKDPKKACPEILKGLGASGIVANKDKLTVIFGKVSSALAKEITQNL